MTQTTVPVAHRDSPYFGLDYYDEKFGAWFFGRESDGGKIITNLRAARLTLLHAESGVGKTSLLRAGVAWRLHRLADATFARGRPVRSIPVVFSSWKDDPATELAAAVGAAVRPYLADGRVPARASGPLDEVIAAAADAAGAGLLIMLDQFEEYFLYRSREPVPEGFADELARCVNRTDLRANFLIAIREDAYAELGDLFKGRITNVYGNYLHIDYLDRASAEKAISGPVEVYNGQPGVSQPVTVQGELVEAVLDEVRAFGRDGAAPAADAGRDRIATPLLQLVMQRVWDTERAEGSHQLRLSTLQQLRGVRMIVDDHLGKAIGSLSGAEREAAIDMFDHLVTPSGGKIAESVSDLAKRTGHAEEQVDGVLRKLDDERILRPVPAAPGQDPIRSRRYEIFHDVLASPINRAIAAREEQRHVRRVRRLAALAVALLVLVSAVAVVFVYLLNSANTEKLTAESRELATDADLHVASNPDLSTSLALQALRLRSTSQAEDALQAALPALQLLRTFHDGSSVSSASFDPADPDKVVSADNSGNVWIWNVRTGQRVEQLNGAMLLNTGSATAEDVNPAGTQVAVSYELGTIAVFDLRTGVAVATAAAGQKQVFGIPYGVPAGVRFLGNTGEIAVTSEGLFLWPYRTAATYQCCGIALSLSAPVTVDIDPLNRSELAVATAKGIVIVNASDPQHLRQHQLSSQPATDARFSPDGREVVAIASGGSVDIYSLATGKVVTTFPAVGTAAVTAAFSPDGKQVVAGYLNGTGRVWDVATGLQSTLLAAHTDQITSAQFSPDGREVVTASGDGTIRVWHAEPRELKTKFTIPARDGVIAVARAEFASNRLLTADGNGNIVIYSPDGSWKAVITGGLTAKTVDWDRSGTKIVTVTPGGTVELWRAAGSSYSQISLQAPISLSEDLSLIIMAISPDGSRLAIASDDGSIQVLNADTGASITTLQAADPVQKLVFSPHGTQIVAADSAGQVEVWNGTGTDPQVLGASGPSLTDVSYNQDGSKFVTASAGGTVSVWNTRTGRTLNSIDACPSPNSAAFSPDSAKIVVACTDGTVRVFDADTGRTLTVIQAASTGVVLGAGYSPDGTSIVAGVDTGGAGVVEIWNSELATSSLPALERIAGQRITEKFTATQLQQYLSGASS